MCGAAPGPQVIVVSAMGSHPESKVKVTDLLLNMVAKAVRQDDAFLLDLAALQVPPPSPGRASVLSHFSASPLECIITLFGTAAGTTNLVRVTSTCLPQASCTGGLRCPSPPL